MTAKSTKNPVPVDSVIDQILRSLGLTRRYYGWQVVTRWNEIVGDDLARKTRAERFEDGVVYVAVPDPGQRQNISMTADMILDKIQSYPFGRVVNQLRFTAGKERNHGNGASGTIRDES